MIILRSQNRILLGLILLLLLLLAGLSATWNRIEANRREPPAGARLVQAAHRVGA